MSSDDIMARGASTRLRVLVLEDDPDTLVLLGKFLGTIPADAVPAATCAAARYAAQTLGPFDIIIADAKLPDGSGIELAIALQREKGCATIILSGSDRPEGELPAGVDLWINKPVRLPQLEKAIRALAKI
jgi:DNA-binding response OmpR family regulator